MAKYAKLKSFYASEKWQKLRMNIISERGPVCQKCHKIIGNPLDCILHHTEELTPENVDDPLVSLNSEKLLIVCHDCHDKIHHRFGYQSNHGVYIVYGPPMSGKTTYVKQNMSRGDLIVDMNRLFEAVSMLSSYDKPDNLLNNVRAVQNTLIDNIKTRYGRWNSAWIIGGYADKYRREKLANDLDAELIFCNISQGECIARLEVDEKRQCRKDEWKIYIEQWFDRYVL